MYVQSNQKVSLWTFQKEIFLRYYLKKDFQWFTCNNIIIIQLQKYRWNEVVQFAKIKIFSKSVKLLIDNLYVVFIKVCSCKKFV